MGLKIKLSIGSLVIPQSVAGKLKNIFERCGLATSSKDYVPTEDYAHPENNVHA